MKLILKRRFLGPEYTIGSLFIDGHYICDTLEDRVRDLNADGDLDDPGEKKVFGETAIPFGDYKVDLTMSPKFQRLLPILLNVRHFTGIRIHRGHIALNTHGCILPGENKKKGEVLNSSRYEMIIVEKILAAKLNHETITMEVTT